MTWSLLNHLVADKVNELLDANATYGPEVERFYSRNQAAAIIHAALWGYGVRSDSTAGAYAAMNMFEALGIKAWSFDAEEAEAIRKLQTERYQAKLAQQEDGTP